MRRPRLESLHPKGRSGVCMRPDGTGARGTVAIAGWPAVASGPRRTRGGATMPMYLTRFRYTPETWAMMIAQPEDRRRAAQAYIESVGGTLHGFWYAFGEYDGFNLWEAPDNVSMAAVTLAIGGGGAPAPIETTRPPTLEGTLEALGRASSVGYQAPGASSA